MAKSFGCRDIGVDCDYRAHADTQEELMEHIAAHAREVHGFESIAPEMLEQIHGAIAED
jgi:predicted small metal-binding protein